MKQYFLASLAAIFLTALAAMAPAQAAEHPCSFVSSANQVFNIENKQALSKVGNSIAVRMDSGVTEYLPDAGGVTWNKIKLSQCFKERYAQSSTDVFFNVAGRNTVTICVGSNTVNGMVNQGNLEYADGCAGHANAKAKAN